MPDPCVPVATAPATVCSVIKPIDGHGDAVGQGGLGGTVDAEAIGRAQAPGVFVDQAALGAHRLVLDRGHALRRGERVVRELRWIGVGELAADQPALLVGEHLGVGEPEVAGAALPVVAHCEPFGPGALAFRSSGD